MFMIVFGNYYNFFIVLPIRLKTCRTDIFFSFLRQNVLARKIGRVSEVLRASAPDWHSAQTSDF